MQDVHVKLHPGLSWKKTTVEKKKKKRRRKLFSPLKFKKATSKMLYLEHSLVWYGNLDTSEIISEKAGKLYNMVLENHG